jgi:integrase
MGLRASESASVTPESFVLRDDGQQVQVQAGYSKHRREDVLPMPDFLARWLQRFLRHRAWWAAALAGAWVDNAAAMLRADLERAGIAYKTDDGYLDFHATRHGALTSGSALWNSRISQRSLPATARSR